MNMYRHKPRVRLTRATLGALPAIGGPTTCERGRRISLEAFDSAVGQSRAGYPAAGGLQCSW